MKSHTMFATFFGTAILGVVFASSCLAGIININGSFEDPVLTKDWANYDASAVPGWQTTASDNRIELWNGIAMSGQLAGSANDFSYDGNQHAELNANMIATLFQDISGVNANNFLDFEFAHRGRSGDDTVKFSITDFGLDNIFGNNDDTVLFSQSYTTGMLAWNFYTSEGVAPIRTLGNTLRFSYESADQAGDDNTFGNFLDAAKYTTNPVPEPATMLLFGVGIIGLFGIRVKRQK